MPGERISTYPPGAERPAETEMPAEEVKSPQEQLQENLTDLVDHRLGEGQPLAEEKKSDVMRVEAGEMAQIQKEIKRVQDMKSLIGKLEGGEQLSQEEKDQAKEIVDTWLTDIGSQQKDNFEKMQAFDSEKAKLEQEYEKQSAELVSRQEEYLKKGYDVGALVPMKTKVKALADRVASMPEKKMQLQAKQEWLGKALASAQDALAQIEKI